MIRRILAYRVCVLVYALVGGVSALVEWLVFFAASIVAGLDYISGSLLAFVFSTFTNYLLSTRVAFLSRGRSWREEAMLIYGVSIIALIVNLAITAALIEILDAPLMAAKVIGTGGAFAFNYALRQFYIFDRRPRYQGTFPG